MHGNAVFVECCHTDMKLIGQLIWETATEFDTKQDEIRAAVASITDKYPMYE